MSLQEAYIRSVSSTLALELTVANHTCLRDVGIGGSFVNLIVQAPGQPRFAIVVDWIENTDDGYMIHEDTREELESVFLCPVYFAVGFGRNCELIRVEQALTTKMLPVDDEADHVIEVFGAENYSRPRHSMVLAVTYVRGDEVKIVLDRANDQLRVRARWPEGALVNGFELRMDQVGRVPLADARRLPVVQEMAKAIIALAEGGLWDQYHRESTC